MKQSQLFTKTRKEISKDEASVNAQLLIRAGFVSKEMAGVYSYLPLGLRVLNKISDVIREEMDAVGGQEILMTVLQDREVWKRLEDGTTRWSTIGLRPPSKADRNWAWDLLTKKPSPE